MKFFSLSIHLIAQFQSAVVVSVLHGTIDREKGASRVCFLKFRNGWYNLSTLAQGNIA